MAMADGQSMNHSHQPSAMTLFRFYPLYEDEALTFGEDSGRAETIRLERFGRIARRQERRSALSPPEQGAEAAASRRADDRHAASGAQHAQELADRRHAIFGAHRTQESRGVVDNRQIESIALDRQPCRRRDFDLDEDARVGGAFARARRGRFIRRHNDRASRQADIAGDGGEPSAVGDADLYDLIAHLHAGHAHGQRVWILTLEKHWRSPASGLQLTSR